MTGDKELLIKFFMSKLLTAQHYDKKATGEKPDFTLYKDNNLFGFCELKSIVDYDFIGLRNDSTFNKIQAKIHKASKQLNSVNQNHDFPNIVFIINHYKKVGYSDLWYVLTGQTSPPNQPSEPIDLRYLKRLLRKDDLSVIDFFIWANIVGDNISFMVNSDSSFKEILKENISSKAYEKVNIRNITYRDRDGHR